MPEFSLSVQLLSSRLPELEWKLRASHVILNPKLLPRGLFQNRLEMTPQSCIEEIRADLQLLKTQTSERREHYLADKISQKINVLVMLCKPHEHKSKNTPPTFGIKSLTTRQQWLRSLEEEIERLNHLEKTLVSTLSNHHTHQDSQVRLNLQAELGEVSRCLTLAKETLTRAIS